MSKKKAFSGSTMTLKDFHGGSIPSDLPLPSAPGVTARPPDRAAYDRMPPSSPWASGGRPDLHRPRPGSAGAGGGGGPSRTLADRGPPFLPNPAHIGRHFDEDERKPFDAAAAAPRRPAPEPIRLAPAPSSPLPKRPLSSPVTPAANPIPAFHPPSSGVPNAWAARKEAGVESAPSPPAAAIWSGPAAASRLAQSSAIEKVSSGRWHSKPQPDVEVIRFHDTEPLLDRKLTKGVITIDGEVDQIYEMERGRPQVYQEAKVGNPYYDGSGEHERVRSPVFPDAKERIPALGRHFEGVPDHERAKSLMYGESKERNASSFYPDGARLASNRERVVATVTHVEGSVNYDKAKSSMYPEYKERTAASFPADGFQPASNEERYHASHFPQQGMIEASERPKIKLLPRTKPMDATETQVFDEKQVYQPFVDSVHIEKFEEPHGNIHVPRPVSSGADAGGRVVERPRLNLKPRSQPLEPSGETAEMARKSLFGGARPRELVLKERGIDNNVADNFDVPSPPNRVRNDVLKTDTKLEPADLTTRPGERTENYSTEQRIKRDIEKKDIRPNLEKLDLQRGSWKSENRKSSKDIEKPMEPRRQEPESWRKPVEQPKPEAPGPRLGKAASALELAQAFSKSVSDPKSDSHVSSLSLPGRPQAPFSRLTGTRELYPGPAQRKINGY